VNLESVFKIGSYKNLILKKVLKYDKNLIGGHIGWHLKIVLLID
jgi:hypothetical protein